MEILTPFATAPEFTSLRPRTQNDNPNNTIGDLNSAKCSLCGALARQFTEGAKGCGWTD